MISYKILSDCAYLLGSCQFNSIHKKNRREANLLQDSLRVGFGI